MLLYDEAFPEVEIKVKTKSLLSPWITKGLLKSSKTKSKLYNKYLKNKTYQNEMTYKNYKNLFESVKSRFKKQYYSKLIIKYKNNVKKTWEVIKKVIGKTKSYNHSLLRKLNIDNEEIYNQKTIAESFNTFFINIGSNLANKIPPSNHHFSTYLHKVDNIMTCEDLTDKELPRSFFLLKN